MIWCIQFRAPAAEYVGTSDQRGLTLTELTLVGILATVVMVALTTFYFNSQNMWIDGSTQALAQRDATLLVNQLRRNIHEARQALVGSTDAEHDHLTLEYAVAPTVEYRWDNLDRKVHLLVGGIDNGPVIDTPVARFKLTTRDSTMVELQQAVLNTAQGDSVSIASQFALLGR